EGRQRGIPLEIKTSLAARSAPDKFLEQWCASLRVIYFYDCHTLLTAVMNQYTPACCAKVFHPICLLKASDEPALPLMSQHKHRCCSHDATFSARDTEQVPSRNKAQTNHSTKESIHNPLTAW